MVTAKEILKQLDIASPWTIRRWADLGLLPKPVVRNLPTGRGRTSFWPDWVLPRCRRIRQLLKAGMSLDQILKVLGNDWKTERAKSRQRDRLAEASAKMDYDAAVRNLVDLIGSKLVPFLGSLGADVRRVMYNLDKFLSHKETIENLVDLVSRGINPVLVYTNGQFHLVPDFMVGHLQSNTEEDDPCIVLSIFSEAITAFSAIESNLPSKPAIMPVPRVTKIDGGMQEFNVHAIGEMDFELSPVGNQNEATREQ